MVKDLEQVFGVSLDSVKANMKRNRIISSVVIFIDIALIVLLVILGWGTGVNMGGYLALCVVFGVVVSLLLERFTNQDYKQVFSFYRRNRHYKYALKKYNVTNDNLFAVLFCTGYARVKSEMSRDSYIELMRSACCQNEKYAKRIMKYLSKYEVSDDADSNLQCYIVVSGKQKFIDVVE